MGVGMGMGMGVTDRARLNLDLIKTRTCVWDGRGRGGAVGGMHVGGVGEVRHSSWARGWDTTQLGWEGDN